MTESKSRKKTESKDSPSVQIDPNQPIQEMSPEERELIARAIETREKATGEAYGARMAEIDAGFEDRIHEIETRVDTFTQVIEFGEFAVYEVPILHPEDQKELTHWLVFTTAPWSDITGGWSIRVKLPSRERTLPGDFWWVVTRGRVYHSEEGRFVPIVQLVVTPQLALRGANVQVQLQMLPREVMMEALKRVKGYKEVEIFQRALDAENEAVSLKKALKASNVSHIKTAGEISAKHVKAHGIGALAYAKALIEAVDWKEAAKKIGIAAVIIILIVLYGYWMGWWLH